MSLKIIGAGWGRTGTLSLKSALEILGVGRCYHMFDLVDEPAKIDLWEKLAKTGLTDFDKLFEGYSCV